MPQFPLRLQHYLPASSIFCKDFSINAFEMVGVPHEEDIKVHITVKCDLLKINLMKHLSNRESWKEVLFCSNSVREKQRGNSTNLIALCFSSKCRRWGVSIYSKQGRMFWEDGGARGQGDTCTSRCWAAWGRLPHRQLPGRIQPGLSAALVSAMLSLMPHSHQCHVLVNATPGSSALKSSQGFCFFTYTSINPQICCTGKELCISLISGLSRMRAHWVIAMRNFSCFSNCSGWAAGDQHSPRYIQIKLMQLLWYRRLCLLQASISAIS